MSNHSRALVPIEVWQYASPDLNHAQPNIDIGLFAESLVYYEQIFVNVGNHLQFARFISWFAQRGLLDQLTHLLQDEIIKIYNYDFYTLPRVGDKVIDLFNIVEKKVSEQTFLQRYLEIPEVRNIFSDTKSHEDFCRILDGKVVQASVADFESALGNARADFINPQRHSLILQSLIDEIYAVKNLGVPPKVQTTVIKDGLGRPEVRVDLDLNQMATRLGINGVDTRASAGEVLSGLAFSAAGKANNLITSAMKNGIDLYLPRPISLITGDKLYEADNKSTAKSKGTIDVLQEEVEFPDLRRLMNNGEVQFADIMLFRQKAKPFRKWLQDEAERDRNAIIAYHHEVAKDVGYIRYSKKCLEIFGKLGGGAIGSLLGTVIVPEHPIIGAAVGAFIGDKVSFLSEIGAKLGSDWKPVVFGNWYKERINKILQTQVSEDKLFNPLGINQAMRQAEELRRKRAEKRLRNRKQP